MTAAPDLKQVKGHRWGRKGRGMPQVGLIRNSTFETKIVAATKRIVPCGPRRIEATGNDVSDGTH